jgi:hypothetical protein
MSAYKSETRFIRIDRGIFDIDVLAHRFAEAGIPWRVILQQRVSASPSADDCGKTICQEPKLCAASCGN